MIYLLDPVDNYFFRSSVPFEAGGDTTAGEGMFPPMPSVYGGALKPYKKEAAGKHRLKIGFNGLWIDGEPAFLLPSDLFLSNNESEKELVFSVMGMREAPISSYPLPYMPYVTSPFQKKDKPMEMVCLKSAELMKYLNGAKDNIEGMDIGNYFVQESKTGIQIDQYSSTAKEGMLYTVKGIRPVSPVKLKLAVEAKGIVNRLDGVVKLGGEGKRAYIHSLDYNLDLSPELEESRFFKLYLATPAIFTRGWLPEWIDPNSKTGYFHYRKRSIRVKLVSAVINRPVPCGGFGFNKHEKEYRPRELKFAVPAGSVYYFQILKGSFEDAVQLFHNKCISDYREEMKAGFTVKYNRLRYCDRGFGYTLAGRVTKEQEEIFHV